jgi:uncharacterized protein DUF5678
MTAMLYFPPMPMDWTHLFKKHKGQWVALADDETTVVAAASSAKEALATSAARGTPDPILYRVPDTLEAFAGYEICI